MVRETRIASLHGLGTAVKCPNCHAQNREDHRFCPDCGAPLSVSCPSCGYSVEPGKKFCGGCGYDLSKPIAPSESPLPEQTPEILVSEGERRQATVLFSDLSGYTAMNEKLDPEEVEGIMSNIKAKAVRIVESHGGIVTQFVGDEVLALFGIPMAHEDDPSRAVRAALGLHEMIGGLSPEIETQIGRTLRMHTGISTGLVVTSTRDQRDGAIGVTGDTVNTGARLKSLAGDGDILISPDTQRGIAPFFETEALPPAELKGKDGTMMPYRVVGESQVQTRFEAAEERGFTPFTGREQELDTLKACLKKALSGAGQFVTAVGEAGVGKSRLLYEFRHGLDREHVTVLQGRCQSYGTNTPYLPVIDSLRRGLRLAGEEDQAELLNKVVANVKAIDPALEKYLPACLHLLSIPSKDYPLAENLTGDILRMVLQEAYAAITIQSTKTKPLVFLLEDWHWADEASDTALRYLIDLIAPHALLLIVSYRPEYSANWGSRDHHTSISLTPLDAANGEHIVRSVLEVRGLPEGFSELIHKRTGGNPFFIEEICSNLMEEGAVQVRDEKVSLSVSPEQLSLPDTVQAVLRSRLDRLDNKHREILRMASVIGERFSLKLLERAFPAEEHMVPGLEALKGQDLIQQVRILPEVEFKFKHVLTQVVVYETMLVQKRKLLHRQVGEAIETLYTDRLEEHYEALAHHYWLGELWDRAVQYYKAAGLRAASLSAHHEAVNLLRRALEGLAQLPPDDVHAAAGIDLRIALRHSLFPLQRFDEIGAVLEEALPIARKQNDRPRLGAILGYLSLFYLGIGRHADTIRLGNQALQIADELHDSTAGRNVLFQLIQANVSLGDYNEAVALDKRLLSEAETHADSGQEQLIFVSLARTWLVWCLAELGHFPEAFEQSERAFLAANSAGQPLPILLAHLAHGLAFLRQGRYEEAVATLEEAYPLSLNPAMEAWKAALASPLGRAYAYLDRADRAIELLEEAVSRTTSTRGTGHALRVLHLGESYLMAERIGDAESYANQAMELALNNGERGHEAYALLLSGQICAAGGEPDYPKAVEQIEAATRLAEELSMKPLQARSLYALATYLGQTGDEDAAQIASAKARHMAGELELIDIPSDS